MTIFGATSEWLFVESLYHCDIKNCQDEVIVFERWSGRRLCAKHAEDENVLDNARKNLNTPKKPKLIYSIYEG